VKIYYSDHFHFPLPVDHRFPVEKYALLRKRILDSGISVAEDLVSPRAATPAELLRAHDPEYIRRLQNGDLTDREMRRIGFPWSPQLVERAMRSAGATIDACAAALAESVAVCLSGGTHHAFRDRGEGYCVLNDSAIASEAIRAHGDVDKVLILDCDVHQGNGTASILADNPHVFTFSIHGKNNFPYHKEKSDLDIALADGTGDTQYLQALKKGLDSAFSRSQAAFVIYLAGADPYVDDRFGRLSLSKAGLAERDRVVFHYCRMAGTAVVVTMSGGYARKIEDSVDIHFQTVKLALRSESHH
jgi:acetoin utilization deacetylase AcuC-like enzyme